MTQESRRHLATLAVVRKGGIECARGTRGCGQIADQVKITSGSQERWSSLAAACRGYPMGLNVLRRTFMSAPPICLMLFGSTRHTRPSSESPAGRKGACTRGHVASQTHSFASWCTRKKEAALPPGSHTASIRGLL